MVFERLHVGGIFNYVAMIGKMKPLQLILNCLSQTDPKGKNLQSPTLAASPVSYKHHCFPHLHLFAAVKSLYLPIYSLSK